MPRSKHDPNAQVVATNDLATILEPLVQRLNTELSNPAADRWNNSKKGAVEVIADRTHEALNTTRRSVPRRLWSIRARESISTDISIAETILWLGFDVNIEELDLPTFPTNLVAAREMVKCRVNEKLSRADVDALALSLLHFSGAYLTESADPETHKYLRHADQKRRNRRARREQEEMQELIAA